MTILRQAIARAVLDKVFGVGRSGDALSVRFIRRDEAMLACDA
jgi:hypothetical protein